MIEKILKLGNPLLYQKSSPFFKHELDSLQFEVDLLHNLIIEVRKVYGFGRGIAAPQIGLMKKLVCLNIESKRHTLYNPVLSDFSDELISLWDDCMCFPNLLVKVNRHKGCKLQFRDNEWKIQNWTLEGDLSELLQHECDHLDGILATQRAIDDKSFKIKAG